MPVSLRDRLALAGVLAVAAVVFFSGLDWGLPTRRVDPYLFGDRPVWTGRQIQALSASAVAQWDDPSRGADVDADPLRAGNQPVVVNATDEQRAQIVRRYRLFTHQPDEMITLMSLSRMRPGQGDLDPRLYQYGGLWIYPVGAMLKVAAMLQLIDLRGGPEGMAYYLDHPEAFGRFYVVARFYSALWALIGVAAVFAIMRRITGGVLYPTVGALCFAFMPVVVNMAHEAKPHLPGAVLVLLAVLAAARFVETGTWRTALVAGALCGAAFGMVLSTLPVFAVLPAMTLLRPMRWAERFKVTLLTGLSGATVYALTNPYVVLNQFVNREVFESNIQNSSAMYHVGQPLAGALNEALLMAAGASPVLALTGLLGAVLLGVRAVRVRTDDAPEAVRRRAAGVLLAVPSVLIAVQFAWIGAGKPGEFGRFLLVPDIFLAVEAVAAVATFVRPVALRATALTILVSSTALAGSLYLRGFMLDSRDITPRLVAAEELRQLQADGAHALAVTAEPAPYALPPVDLFKWQIVKLPAGQQNVATQAPTDVLVQALDVPQGTPEESTAHSLLRKASATRISWAAKPFWVRTTEPPPLPPPQVR